MKTEDSWGKPTFVISTDFSFFLRFKILNTSFLLESLVMTLFGLAFDFNQWQASIFGGSTGVSHSLKIFKMQSSKSSSWIDSGIPEISRHSRREYCPFAQHFLSNKISCLVSLSLTFRLMARSDSSLRKSVFCSFSSSFIAIRLSQTSPDNLAPYLLIHLCSFSLMFHE